MVQKKMPAICKIHLYNSFGEVWLGTEGRQPIPLLFSPGSLAFGKYFDVQV